MSANLAPISSRLPARATTLHTRPPAPQPCQPPVRVTAPQWLLEVDSTLVAFVLGATGGIGATVALVAYTLAR